jgi:hypothetical protein
MNMSRGKFTGFDERIKTLNAQSRTSEAKCSLCGRNEGSDLVQLHLVKYVLGTLEKIAMLRDKGGTSCHLKLHQDQSPVPWNLVTISDTRY